MRLFVGVTDGDWFRHLAAIPAIDEVNFWQPSGSSQFRALAPGEVFLFKLHSPRNFIVGGGVFAHMSLLPVSLAWEAFGGENGVGSLDEMRRRIERYRRSRSDEHDDYRIGCMLLEQPFFLPREAWIPAPADWSSNIAKEVPRRAPSLRGARAAVGGPGNEAICLAWGRLLRRPAASSQ